MSTTLEYQLSNIDLSDAPRPLNFQRLTSVIEDKLGDLIFRRVSYVDLKERDYLGATYYRNDDDYYPITPENWTSFTQRQVDENLEYRYRSFSFVTNANACRDSDDYDGFRIYGFSSYYANIDFTDKCTFDMVHVWNQIPPRVNDLVCGRVIKTEKGYAFSHWFTCSEQFLRAWTAMIYDNHRAFNHIARSSNEVDLRRRLMCGNRLCTNTYKKWIMGGGIPENWDENTRARYRRLRTESASVKWCHLYAALVTMIRYHELPSPENVPKNQNGPSATSWDIPRCWVQKITTMYLK